MTNVEKKQVAIVTGASSGLGLECSRELMNRGVSTVMVARRSSVLKESAALLGQQGGAAQLYTLSADVGVLADVQKLSRFLDDQGLTVKWLINNAGAGRYGELGSYSANDINEVFKANLIGMILMSQEFLKQLIENEGVLCNIMSTAALNYRAKETIYTAAKWGAKAFTEALRAELKGKPIRVIAVYPGGMNTPFWEASRHYVPDSSKFMKPSSVAERIVSNIFDATDCQVSDITINRL